jgi:uncharacterized protein (TIGR00251 family)
MGHSRGGDSRTETTPDWLVRQADRWVLALHVQPGARRTGIIGRHGDRLKIAVAAPATAGRANDRLLEFLAERLGTTKRSLGLLSGGGSRAKRVALPGELRADAIVAMLRPSSGAP